MTKAASPFSGFKRATVADYDRHRLIGMSAGEPGSRKTTFWLEGPSPIAVFSLDQGLEGVVNRVLTEFPEKEIHVWEKEWFPTKDQDLREEAIALRDEFMEQYEIAIANARTVLLDKENDFWALFRYAEFGPEANGEQRDYDALNMRYRRLVNMGKASDCNIGFICGMKDKWGAVMKGNGQKGKGPTGNREPAGFKELSGLVHMVLTHTGVGPADWEFTVGKARGPATLDIAGQPFGKGIENPDMPMTFAEFASLVFPESDPAEWV